jgi:pimeloyl-ACP methyl ester carboxylesterase
MIGDMHRHDITVNGIRLRYAEYGDASAEPLLLLHCLGEGGGDWAEIAEVLAADYRVIAPDLRGHGQSEWPGVYSYELMRDDVLGLADALALQDVTLVGHSLGGTVAWLVAQRNPTWLKRLVIEDSPPPKDRNTFPLQPRPDVELPFDWAMMESIAAQSNAPDPAWWDDLSLVRVPTLLISATEGRVPPGRASEAAALVPECQVVEISTGHHIHRTRPEEFLAAFRGSLVSDPA